MSAVDGNLIRPEELRPAKRTLTAEEKRKMAAAPGNVAATRIVSAVDEMTQALLNM